FHTAWPPRTRIRSMRICWHSSRHSVLKWCCNPRCHLELSNFRSRRIYVGFRCPADTAPILAAIPISAREGRIKMSLRRIRFATLIAGVLWCCLCIVGCKPSAAQPASERVAVGVAKPVVKEIVDWDEYTGRLAAVDSVDVRARVGGYLDAIQFKDG